MKNRELNDEYILSKGYKEFSPTRFHNSSVVKCFQKRFTDDIGKRYFININKWYWGDIVPEYRKDEWYQDYTYEYEVQLYRKDTHDAVDISFHSSWTLEQDEEHMEKLFETGMYDYYEMWSES